MTKDKKASKNKEKLSDRLERMIREEYLPFQLKDALEEILRIEVNSEWLSTAEGRQVEGYTDEEAQSILGKQAKRKELLQLRVDVVKRLIDKQKK